MEEKFIGFSGFKVIETYWSQFMVLSKDGLHSFPNCSSCHEAIGGYKGATRDMAPLGFQILSFSCTVADPGFPPGGGSNCPGGRQHTILPKFPKNCMKLKEFVNPRGRDASKILLCRSATDIVFGKKK